jgi:hypothetical protein
MFIVMFLLFSTLLIIEYERALLYMSVFSNLRIAWTSTPSIASIVKVRAFWYNVAMLLDYHACTNGYFMQAIPKLPCRT